jgi:HEAT repeat protein
LKDRRALKPLLDALGNPKGPQCQAAWALGMLNDERAVGPLIKALIRDDKAKKMYLASEIILALARINSLKSLKPLLDIVQDETYSIRIRRVVGELLGRLGDDRATPILIEVLKKEYRRKRGGLRHCTMFSLGEIVDERVVDILLDILPESDVDFQMDIINELPRYGAAALELVEQRLKTAKPKEKILLRRALKLLRKSTGGH